METVGIYLKRERESNNISLRDVAQTTKITSMYLEHIERNEFDKIPQGPYIKGYLSSYSKAIGCDVDKTINLYESATHKRTQDKAIGSASVPIDDGKHSIGRYDSKMIKRRLRLRLGDLRSWFNSLVSVVAGKCASLKAAKKPADVTDTSEPNNRKPLRKRLWGVKQSSRHLPSRNGSKDRRFWLYACTALFGAFMLFFSGVGFYHLFLYDPDPATIAEAERTPETNEVLLPSVGSRPSIGSSPSTDVTGAADTPNGHVSDKRISEFAKADVSAPDAKPEAYISSETSIPPLGDEKSSIDGFLTARPKALVRDNADVKSTEPSDRKKIEKEPLSESTAIGAALKVSEAAICRTIENRMPAGTDRVFSTSAGKIYVWTKIEAMQVPSKIRHIYYFDGKQVSEVSLDVRSAHWRTWSSKTIANHRYRGEWRVDITTSNGDILRRLYFEVE